jgi:hypothetical protein
VLVFAFSSVFLISYIVNAVHDDTIFPGLGPARRLYLSILASHVVLSVLALSNGAHDALFLTDEVIRYAPPNRTLDVSHLALRFDHRYVDSLDLSLGPQGFARPLLPSCPA